MDYENIDFDKLRNHLSVYFNEGIYENAFGVSDVLNVDKASDLELIKIAIENGFNLEDYKKDPVR